jgi:DNA-directed RNA polymerase specialized sigma24 family protein
MIDRAAPTSQAARLASPAVAEKILAVVKRRAAESDVADVVQATYLRALLVPRLPDDEEELLRLVATIARGQAIDSYRRGARRSARIEDAAEPDEVALEDGESSDRDSVEAREMLAWIEHEVKRGKIPAEVLGWSRELAAGATCEEIALREGKTASAIKVALHRARKLVHRRWRAHVTAAAFGTLAFAMVCALWPDEEHEVSAPYVTPAPPAAVRLEQARELRQRAHGACADARWEECLRYFNEAQRRDPAGDDDPAVQAERTKARNGLAK